GVGEVGLPIAVGAEGDVVARRVTTALQAPWRALGAIALAVHRHRAQRAHRPRDAEAAAMPPRPTRIRNELEPLDHDRILGLGLLVRTIVGVAVVKTDRGRYAVLGLLGAPAAAERTERADEELAGLRVHAMEARRDQVRVMAGDGAVGHRLLQRLED